MRILQTFVAKQRNRESAFCTNSKHYSLSEFKWSDVSVVSNFSFKWFTKVNCKKCSINISLWTSSNFDKFRIVAILISILMYYTFKKIIFNAANKQFFQNKCIKNNVWNIKKPLLISKLSKKKKKITHFCEILDNSVTASLRVVLSFGKLGLNKRWR